MDKTADQLGCTHNKKKGSMKSARNNFFYFTDQIIAQLGKKKVIKCTVLVIQGLNSHLI